MKHLRFSALATAALILLGNPAHSQDKKDVPKPPEAQKQQPAPRQEQLKMDTATLIVMIKSAMIALQQANQTGNYSVLRDLGTPVFRERFDQAKLTAIFANMRARGISLYPVFFLAPNLTKQPELTAQNTLHLVGNFPTQPLQIQFEFLFMQLDGAWRIEGLAVDAVPVPGAQAMAAAEPVQKPDAAQAATAAKPQPTQASGKKPAKSAN